MTYLKSTTCDLLHKLGVKCETGKWYDRQNRLVHFHMGSSVYTPGGIGTSDMVEYTPAYSLPLLITDSEAMKLVFPVSGNEGVFRTEPQWIIKAHQLLGLCLSGNYEAAEKLLVEALERTSATS